MNYAMRDSSGVLLMIFEADNLAAAVALKHHLQRQHNEDWGIDDIFSIAKATPRDFRENDRHFEP